MAASSHILRVVSLKHGAFQHPVSPGLKDPMYRGTKFQNASELEPSSSAEIPVICVA